MVDIVNDMLASELLARNSRQMNYRYIAVAKLFQQQSKIIDMIGHIRREETGARTLDISHLDEEILSTSCTEEAPLLVRAAIEYIGNAAKHLILHAPTFHNSG